MLRASRRASVRRRSCADDVVLPTLTDDHPRRQPRSARRAIRSTGAIPSSTTRTRSTQELERIFDICHGCRRCVSLCERVPDAVRPGRREQDQRGRRRRQVRLRQGRRPVLPVRPLLHDEVPVRSAASVERRFPAPDAARARRRNSGNGESSVPRQAAHRAPTASASWRRFPWSCRWSTRPIARRSARKVMDRTLGIAAQAALPPYAKTPLRETRAASVAWPVRDGARTPGKVAIFATCYVNYNEPGHRPRSGASSSSTTRFRTGSSSRRPAAACRSSSSATWRRCSASRTSTCRRSSRWRAQGYAILTRGAVVHAHVQAGAAAAVPGRRRREGGGRRDVRSVRVLRAARQGRAAEARSSSARSAR